MVKWLLTVTQIIETPNDMTEQQVIDQLTAQRVVRGATDIFTLQRINESETTDEPVTDSSDGGETAQNEPTNSENSEPSKN